MLGRLRRPRRLGIHLLLWSGQCDVLRTRGQLRDSLQERGGRLLVVKAQSELGVMIPGGEHGVEEGVLRRVSAQVVQRVLPQREAGAALGEDELDAAAAAGTGTAGVKKEKGNTGVLKLPL